jgi:hypothetical protein
MYRYRSSTERERLHCFWVVYICLPSYACILYKKLKKKH